MVDGVRKLHLTHLFRVFNSPYSQADVQSPIVQLYCPLEISIS